MIDKLFKEEINFPQLIREISLRIIMDEIKFEISEDRYQEFIKTKIYKAYKKCPDGSIISGSSSLKLFDVKLDRGFKSDTIWGYIKRYFYGDLKYIKDLDIVNEEVSGFPSIIYNGLYGDSELDEFVVTTKIGDVYVDIFQRKDQSFTQYKDIKVSSPLDVIKFKTKMLKQNKSILSSTKHYIDINRFLNQYREHKPVTLTIK